MQLFFSNLVEELERGTSIIYATLLNKKGSTPQIPGASAVFSEKGLMFGTLGGGILEAEIQEESAKALKSDSDRTVDYNLDASMKDEKGAICGGYATVLIDTHPYEYLAVFHERKVIWHVL